MKKGNPILLLGYPLYDYVVKRSLHFDPSCTTVVII